MAKELFSNPEETPAQPVTPEVTPEVPTPAQEVPSYDDHLKSIVTDDGSQKYADVPTALNGLKNAQDHIKNLTAQLAEAKTKVEEAKGIDDVLAQLNKEEPATPPTSAVPAGISQEDVLKLLDAKLIAQQKEAQENANADALRSSLKAKFGDDVKAAIAFKEKAVDLGMSTEQLTEIAVQNPKLVLGHFAIQQAPATDPTAPQVNPEQLPNGQKPELKPVPLGATTEDLVNSYKSHAKQ